MKQKHRLAIGLLLAAGLGATDLSRGGDNGNVLLENCELISGGPAGLVDRSDAMNVGFCMGMIEGIAETLSTTQMAAGGKSVYCPPKGLTSTERIHGVIRHLKARKKEELSSRPRFYWGLMALLEIYPCP